MQNVANNFIEATAQCWACPVFDKLFTIISNTAAAAYQKLTSISVVIFVVLFVFYILNAVWQNIKRGGEDSMFTKSIQRVTIKSMIVLSMLAMGIIIPQFISKITFEPASIMALKFAEVMLPSGFNVTDSYTPIQLSANGFFTPELRDTILQLIKTSVANFQVFIEMGINVIDKAFSISMLSGIDSLIRHFIVALIGVVLTYNFGKLFIKYSFCFMDIIMAMAIFAFMFPLSVVLFIFQGASDVPSWMSNLGKGFGGNQIKKIINAIVSVAATIFTYTVIGVIITGYLAGKGVDATSFHPDINTLFNLDLDNSDIMQLTFSGAIVLLFVYKLHRKTNSTNNKQNNVCVWYIYGKFIIKRNGRKYA